MKVSFDLEGTLSCSNLSERIEVNENIIKRLTDLYDKLIQERDRTIYF